MAKIRVVSRKVYNQVWDLLLGDNTRGLRGGSVVLMPVDLAMLKGYRDNDDVDYDFGGEPDVHLDLVDDDGHYFFNHEEEDDEEGDD